MTPEFPKTPQHKVPRVVEGIEKRKNELKTENIGYKARIEANEEEIARLDSGAEQERAIHINGSFVLPPQTEVLDFKAFIEKPLFNGTYYLHESEDFKDLVVDTALPFNGMEGNEYTEADLHWQERDEGLMTELSIEPLTLDEWRYLFSQLREEQLLGETTFYVNFDDKIVRAIRTSITRDGGGPYSYNVKITTVGPETSIEKKSLREPKVIFRKKNI